jgi:hypothetical protein
MSRVDCLRLLRDPGRREGDVRAGARGPAAGSPSPFPGVTLDYTRR